MCGCRPVGACESICHNLVYGLGSPFCRRESLHSGEEGEGGEEGTKGTHFAAGTTGSTVDLSGTAQTSKAVGYHAEIGRMREKEDAMEGSSSARRHIIVEKAGDGSRVFYIRATTPLSLASALGARRISGNLGLGLMCWGCKLTAQWCGIKSYK